MIITAIKRRRGGVFAVFADGDEAALVDEAALELSELSVGEDIEPGRFWEIAAQSNLRMAKNRALGIVARKEVCRAELIHKLSADYDEDVCCETADEMERLGFVDDGRYAEMYLDVLYRVKKYGFRRAAYELTQKGIDRDMAKTLARELEPDAAQALDELLNGKLSGYLGDEAGVRRCVNTLVRYGYESEDIFAALHRAAEKME